MLVLSRRNGETISLPEHNIPIRVLRVSGSRVQIGIDAPSEVAIRRSELLEDPSDAIGNEAAAGLSSLTIDRR